MEDSCSSDGSDEVLNNSASDVEVETQCSGTVQELANAKKDHSRCDYPVLFPCHECKFIVTSTEEYEKHCGAVHYEHSCRFCGHLSHYKGQMDKHETECHSNAMKESHDEFGLEIDESDFKLEIAANKTKKERTFRCRKCMYETMDKEEFFNHKDEHTVGIKKHSCEIVGCSFKTSYKHHLEYHLCSKHSNEKAFKCHMCEYTCINKAMLTSHLKSHSAIHPYRCLDCRNSFKHRNQLKKHQEEKGHERRHMLNADGSLPPHEVTQETYDQLRSQIDQEGDRSSITEQLLQQVETHVLSFNYTTASPAFDTETKPFASRRSIQGSSSSFAVTQSMHSPSISYESDSKHQQYGSSIIGHGGFNAISSQFPSLPNSNAVSPQYFPPMPGAAIPFLQNQLNTQYSLNSLSGFPLMNQMNSSTHRPQGEPFRSPKPNFATISAQRDQMAVKQEDMPAANQLIHNLRQQQVLHNLRMASLFYRPQIGFDQMQMGGAGSWPPMGTGAGTAMGGSAAAGRDAFDHSLMKYYSTAHINQMAMMNQSPLPQTPYSGQGNPANRKAAKRPRRSKHETSHLGLNSSSVSTSTHDEGSIPVQTVKMEPVESVGEIGLKDIPRLHDLNAVDKSTENAESLQPQSHIRTERSNFEKKVLEQINCKETESFQSGVKTDSGKTANHVTFVEKRQVGITSKNIDDICERLRKKKIKTPELDSFTDDNRDSTINGISPKDNGFKRRRSCSEADENASEERVESRFECVHCLISFGDVNMFTLHMSFHSLHDSFQCAKCGVKRNSAVGFSHHIATDAHN